MQKLLNAIISEFDDEIIKIQESYANCQASDYAEYIRRVGEENALKKAKEIIGEAYKKWVNDDGLDE